MVTETILSLSEIRRRVSFELMLDELLERLRNNVSDRISNRIKTSSDTFTGDGSTTTFEFTNDFDSRNRHKVMSVSSVTINGVAQTSFTDYIIGYRKESPILGKIQFWNAPANSSTIIVKYSHTYHFIYPEEPRIDLTSNSYPRINIDLSGKPVEAGTGGKSTRYEIIVKLSVIDTKRDFVEKKIQFIKDFFSEEVTRKSFITFRYIYVTDVGDLAFAPGEDPNDRRYGQQMELLIPFEYEFSK